MTRARTTILSVLLLVGACSSVSRAVTCESFQAPEECNGVVTDSGACFWNETKNLCIADDMAEGLVAITSFQGETAEALNGTFCTQEPETGNCRGMFPSWYYSADNNSCEQFIYGGCGGNTNRFETGEACASVAEELCPDQTKGEQVTIKSAAAAVFKSTIVLSIMSIYYLM